MLAEKSLFPCANFSMRWLDPKARIAAMKITVFISTSAKKIT